MFTNEEILRVALEQSARNAIKSGFRPAWAQMTVKSLDMINEMNGR